MSERERLARQLRFAARDHREGKIDSFASVHTALLLQAADALGQADAPLPPIDHQEWNNPRGEDDHG
jgi:hypothetical protein